MLYFGFQFKYRMFCAFLPQHLKFIR
jgi:hypothetical protein